MEEIRCIFCDLASDRVVIEENGFLGRKCPQCGLIYISPRPTLSEIQQLYSHDGAHVSAGTHVFGEFRRKLIARHTLRLMRRYIDSGALLEIGSGSGYFLEAARKEGFDVYGIELNDVLAEFTRSRLSIPCAEKPLGDDVFEGTSFDVVYHRDVISHFYDPIEEFHKFNRRLNEDGWVIFETGNLGDMDEKYIRIFPEFQYPDHLFFFSEKNLADLLARTGFTLVATYRYSIVPQLRVLGTLDRLINRIKPLRKARQADDIRKGEQVPAAVDNRVVQTTGGRKLAKSTYNRLYYWLRYRVGGFAPKSGRPQTLIVVARKTS